MGSLFGLLLAVFAVVWLFLVVRGAAREFKRVRRSQWLVALMYFLILAGAGGFFAQMLSAVGLLKVSTSREWPAGYVSGIARTADGKYIVPLVPSGRVQLYDSQWHFLRGWHVDAEGGDFKVQCLTDGAIEVFTERGEHHYSFAEDGRLIASTRRSSETYSLLPKGQSAVVRTSPFLWMFSSPLLSWAVALIGFAGTAILRKMRREKVGPR
jgi:hypothetical protein